MRREGPPAPDCSAFGAIEGTRTPTPLRVHGPEPCASANSATMAKILGDGPHGPSVRKNYYSTGCRRLLPSLAFELRGHGDIGFEQLRYWTSALGIFRRFLERSLIRVGHPADYIQMNRGDGPARLQFFHSQRGRRLDARGRQIGAAQLS